MSLSQESVVPVDIVTNLERLKTMIQDGLGKARRLPAFGSVVEQGELYWRDWLGTSKITVPAGLYSKARDEIVLLFYKVVPWLKAINMERVPGAVEKAKAEAGASFANQVLMELGIAKPTQVYKPEIAVPSFSDVRESVAESISGLPGWVWPVGAGVVALFFLRGFLR